MTKKEWTEKLRNSFSAEELADLCGLPLETVLEWIEDRKLHAWRIGNQYRISISDLEDEESKRMDVLCGL